MKCDECGKEVVFNENVLLNIESYRKPVIAISKCCGIAYIVSPRMSYNVFPYKGKNVEDDWGNPIKKREEEK